MPIKLEVSRLPTGLYLLACFNDDLRNPTLIKVGTAASTMISLCHQLFAEEARGEGSPMVPVHREVIQSALDELERLHNWSDPSTRTYVLYKTLESLLK